MSDITRYSQYYQEDGYETRRISNFLEWASKRIKDEIDEIDRMEAEYGNSEWVRTKQCRGRPSKLSDEEKIELIQEVDKLRDEGKTYRDACEAMVIAPSSYTKWRKKFNLGFYGDVSTSK